MPTIVQPWFRKKPVITVFIIRQRENKSQAILTNEKKIENNALTIDELK